MTTELWSLLVFGLWTMALIYAPAFARSARAGLAWSAGNRETTPETSPWVARADRALRNHLENAPLFTIGVVVAHEAGVHDDVTRGAAVVFVVARLLHAFCYWAGLTPWRSVVFGAAVVAQLAFVSRLF